MNLEIVNLPLDQLTVDLALQPRVGGLDADHVRNLQDASESWPPLAVVKREGKYLLVDGFHRLAAAQNLELETVPVRVEDMPPDGDLHALAFALNAAHGRPLSLSDRRAFAERLLRQQPQWADREIGRRCGLSSNTVGGIREQLERTAKIEQTHVRVGAGGYTYAVGTNERKRQTDLLPEVRGQEPAGGDLGRTFTPEERTQQRQIAHYLQRLASVLEEQDSLGGWQTAEDAAESLRLVVGPERAQEVADRLGYACRNVLDVAVLFGYEEGRAE